MYKRGFHPHTSGTLPYALIFTFFLLLGIMFLTFIYREIFVWDDVFNRDHLGQDITIAYYTFISLIFLLSILLTTLGIYPMLKILAYVFGKVKIDQLEDNIMVKYSFYGISSLKFEIPKHLNPKIILIRKNYFLQLLSEDIPYYSVYLGRIR